MEHGPRKFFTAFARMAELADALDLGSSSITEWGFKSPSSHVLEVPFAL